VAVTVSVVAGVRYIGVDVRQPTFCLSCCFSAVVVQKYSTDAELRFQMPVSAAAVERESVELKFTGLQPRMLTARAGNHQQQNRVAAQQQALHKMRLAMHQHYMEYHER
jgi:hypothetical protein